MSNSTAIGHRDHKPIPVQCKAKKGDAVLVVQWHSSTMLHGATSRYAEYRVYRVDSVARDGAIKNASYPTEFGRRTIDLTDRTIDRWVICKDSTGCDGDTLALAIPFRRRDTMTDDTLEEIKDEIRAICAIPR